MAPRGKPSTRASSDARPVGRHSRILASGRSPSVVTRAAFGFMQFRLFFATHILLTWSTVVKSTRRGGMLESRAEESARISCRRLWRLFGFQLQRLAGSTGRRPIYGRVSLPWLHPGTAARD